MRFLNPKLIDREELLTEITAVLLVVILYVTVKITEDATWRP